MRIPLIDEKSNRRDVLNFDPDPHPSLWIEQNKDADHLLLLQTGLRPPFHQVFLKRWKDKEAPAHELLKTICGKTLPGTPRVFGMERHGDDVIYVYELMKEYDTLDNWLKNNTNLASLVSPGLMKRIIDQSAACFEALERYQYVYTDFNTKNIMRGLANEVVLIDLDSAWSVQHLLKYWNNTEEINKIDRRFWLLWYDHIIKRRGVDAAASSLHRSMVLSFAAILGRALGLFNLRSPAR